MLDAFKAKLLDAYTFPSKEGRKRQIGYDYPIMTFTKDIIVFPKIDQEIKQKLASHQVYDKSKYELHKLSRYDNAYSKGSKFQVIFSDTERYNLQLTSWNHI